MIIKIKVKPSSGRQEIEKISKDEYKVWLKSPPEDGKANGELLKLLKKEFGFSVKIKSGKTSRNKVVEVSC
jgi:uncharacterized protein (TIGR00251 family)